MLDTLDRTLDQIYNRIISNRIVIHAEKIPPSIFGFELYIPPNYFVLKETIKQYGYTIKQHGYTIAHAIKKYLKYK